MIFFACCKTRSGESRHVVSCFVQAGHVLASHGKRSAYMLAASFFSSWHDRLRFSCWYYSPELARVSLGMMPEPYAAKLAGFAEGVPNGVYQRWQNRMSKP